MELNEMIFIRVPSLCWILFLVSASKVPENTTITCTSGQDAILECKAAKKGDCTVVKWTKSDLKDEYIFLQVDSHIESENQHPSFKNRVDLQDREMKDGDASLILKNVTINDAGTYECRVLTQTNRRKRANLQPVTIITLRVVAPPGPTGGETEDGGKEDEISRGHLGIIIPPSFICVAAILITVKKKKNSSLTLPSDKESEQMPV